MAPHATSTAPFDAQQNGTTAASYSEDRNAKSSDVTYTTSNGAPVTHPYRSQRQDGGPLLLQDFHLIDMLSHFDRERIPERVVHAKGGGAHGYYKTTDTLEDLTMADLFQAGKTCPISVRFSTVGGESGSHDMARDPRGFSVKFRTEEGNWDVVANNTPVFFLRDALKFPFFIHTQKRDPSTHLTHADDSTHFWSYAAENPESVHQFMILMGDRGIPKSWRNIHGYYGHTMKLVKADGSWVYVQFHFKSKQGADFVTQEDSHSYGPDASQKDLYTAIEKGEYPGWDVMVQTMTAKEAEQAWENDKINVLDMTHVWPQGKYPLRKVGEFVLNENVKNYFSEIEQIAFSPSHVVPGIEPSADPVLQSRLFSYPDTHRHRLGVNYQQLPINQHRSKYQSGNFQRDGQMAFYNQGSRANYLSSVDPIYFSDRETDLDRAHGHYTGQMITALSELREEDFNAPRALWQKVFDDAARERWINNVSGHMSTCTNKEALKKQIAIFRTVDPDIGARLEKALDMKGYDTVRDLSFMGSHNGMATNPKHKNANGMKSRANAFNSPANGAPVPSTHGGIAAR